MEQPSSTFSADRYLQELRASNVAVWKDQESKWCPIPAALSPVTVSRQDWHELVCDAQLILSTFPVLQRWLQKPEQSALFQILNGNLNGGELAGARADPEYSWGHATIRLDLFWHQGELKVIEANCTIPAMQAYSDLVLSAWMQASGRPLNQAQNSNQLLESLLALYHRDGGTSLNPNIAILHRPGDSQLAELLHLEASWSAAAKNKVSAFRIQPDQLKKSGDRLVGKSNGRVIDLVYRHCFAWRLNDNDALRTSLENYRHFHIYNPVSAHYEVKGFFAFLSFACLDPGFASAIGMTSSQINAVRKRVPRTRLVARNLPTRLKAGFDLTAKTFAANVDQYVVKNSFGYGGHQVFMGSEWYHNSSQIRLKKLLNLPLDSNDIAAEDFLTWMQNESTDAWIIQDRMTGRRHQTKIIQSDDKIIELNGFVDASVFLNTGTMNICSGGVSRIAAGPVVNIGMGGGLAPFLVV